MILVGAAVLVSQKGWDFLIGDEKYTRQGVWLWKRDLEAAGVDPFAVEWEGFERGVGTKLGTMLERTSAAARRRAPKASRKEGAAAAE